jgi:hypothetical protein
VGGEILVALLVTGILGDEVEVFAADDQGTCGISVSAKIYATIALSASVVSPEPRKGS